MKKFFAGILAAAILAAMPLSVSAYDITDQASQDTLTAEASLASLEFESSEANTIGDFEVETNNDGTLQLKKYKGSAVKVTVPNTLGGKKVTSLYRTFCDNKNIESVTIPNTVTSIGIKTFYGCKKLSKLTIPSSVKKIDFTSFSESGLEEIKIPDSVEELGFWSFENCTKLKKVNLSKNLKVIEGKMFSGCSSLTEVTVPDGVTQISYSAFANCPKLTKVVIPASVKNITGNIENNEDLFTFYNSPNAVIYGYAGSYAERYAKKENVKFVAVNGTSDPEPVTPAVTPKIVGDVDGDSNFTANDSLDILRASVDIVSYKTAAQKKAADVDGDGEITSNDSLLVLRRSVGYNDKSLIGNKI